MFKKKPKYIGVDIGGSKILLQTFDARLNVLETQQVKTKTRSRKEFLTQLYELIEGVFHKKVKGIGVAVPGIVNLKKGILVKAPHLPTGRDLPLQKLLQKRYATRIHLENDINAFLAAEYEAPSLQKYSNLLAVMVGTGLGGAAIVNGQMLYGKSGYAGEFGHMVIAKGKKSDTLEKGVSGAYNAKLREKERIENFATGLSNLNLLFNPEAIVLGGSVYQYHLKKYKKQIEKIIAKHSLAKEAPKLLDAKGNTSVARGAVLLMVKN